MNLHRPPQDLQREQSGLCVCTQPLTQFLAFTCILSVRNRLDISDDLHLFLSYTFVIPGNPVKYLIAQVQ